MATVTLRMEDEEKRRLDAALENIGMNITTFYSIYTKRFLAEKKIPFDIVINDPFYSDENLAHLRKAIDRLENGQGVYHELIED